MEKTKKCKITTATQFEKLVEELQKNPSLAVGFRRGTLPSNFKEQWEEIAKVLNSLGPPIRLGEGWQKVWRDLKFKVKKKMIANKAECQATGGGIFKRFVFSPLEEAVANLLQFQKQLNPEGAVQGVQLTNVANETQLNTSLAEVETAEIVVPSMEVTVDLTPLTVPPSTSPLNDNNDRRKHVKSSLKKNQNCFVHGELLLKHSTEQATRLNDISNSLGSIKRSLRDFDKRQKDLLDVEVKKIKLLEERNKIDKERNEREQEIHESELKIKSLKILIKEKELQLLNKKLG